MECDLIPVPAYFEKRSGSLDLSGGVSLIAPPEWSDEAGLLAGWMQAALGRPCLVIDASAASAGHPCSVIHIEKDESIACDEAYELEVAPLGIRLAARAGAGVVRGAASLYQMALSGGCVFEAAFIRDAPRFPWRGFMLDTARNFFRVEFIERLIDLAALHKINVFHWHLTDDQAWRLELACAPELAGRGSRRLDVRYNVPRWKAGSYSRRDVRRIVEFARIRHMEVVPEIETPGHATALLASHPELSCAGAANPGITFQPEDRFGVFEDILCAGNDKAIALLEAVLDEVCGLFPGKYIHMGGDEAPKARWKTCPLCLARMNTLHLRNGRGEPDTEMLQAWFMEKMAEMLAARGKKMVGWDEVLEGEIGKGTLIMSWRGYDSGILGARRGYDIVMCPQTKACYLDHKQADSPEEPGHLGLCTLEDSYAFEPVPSVLSNEEASHILGGQGNIWSELLYFGRQVEYMAFPRLCALSEVLWSPKEKRNYGNFLSRMKAHGQRLDALGVGWRRI